MSSTPIPEQFYMLSLFRTLAVLAVAFGGFVLWLGTKGPRAADKLDLRTARRLVGCILVLIGIVVLVASYLQCGRATFGGLKADIVGWRVGLILGMLWIAFVAGMFPGAVHRFRDRHIRKPNSVNVPRPTGPGKDANDADLLELYKIAVDTRKLELTLFWQRSVFFWGFLAATLAGYLAIKPGDNPNLDYVRTLLAHVGLIASVCWFLVNRGSKYWHENWEQMVRALERNEHGLFSQTAPLEPKGPLGAAGYSFSRITVFFSACIACIFVGLTCNEMILGLWGSSEFLTKRGPVALLLFTLTAMAYVWLDGVSGSAGVHVPRGADSGGQFGSDPGRWADCDSGC